MNLLPTFSLIQKIDLSFLSDPTTIWEQHRHQQQEHRDHLSSSCSFQQITTISIQMEEAMSQDVTWERTPTTPREWENGPIQRTVILIIIRLSPFNITTIKSCEKNEKRGRHKEEEKRRSAPLTLRETHQISLKRTAISSFSFFV